MEAEEQSPDVTYQNPWLIGIAPVIFDIDQGQLVENLYPENALTPGEARAVAFHSFPDSMSMELHSSSSIRDSTFCFRIAREAASESRRDTANGSSQAVDQNRQHYHNEKLQYIYGFVFCRQRQDNRLKRGGEQRSLVLLSEHPYTHVLAQTCQWAGPKFFNQGVAALQDIFEEVMEWEPPEPSSRMMLRAENATIFAEVPHHLALPPPGPAHDANELAEQSLDQVLPPLDRIQGACGEADVYTPFKAFLDKLWALWELAVLAQPLLIISPSPGECSAAVASLLGLIAPLPYSADFRPYYTIHDRSFNELLAKQLPDNVNGLPRLLGVTNLYFLKAFPSWPNVVSAGSKPAYVNGHAQNHERKESRLAKAVMRKSNTALSLLSRHTENAWLSYKPLSRPNKELLGRLLKPQEGDSQSKLASIASSNSAALRKHFKQLTVALLQPFQQFFQVSQPPPGDKPLPLQPLETLPPFSHSEFLKGLEKAESLSPALLTCFHSKSACLQFYRQFLESPNFASWFGRGRGLASAWQEAAWQRALDTRGQDLDLNDLTEVRLVEIFQDLELKVEATRKEVSDDSALSPQGSVKLKILTRQLAKVYSHMPRDLQSCLLSSPSRAALLYSLAPPSKMVPGLPRQVVG